MSHKILIIGAGEIGKALANVLKQNKRVEVEFWDKNPRLSSGKNLEELIAKSNHIFLCIPSPAIERVVNEINPYLLKGVLVTSLTKGIEKKGSLFSSEVMIKRLGKRRIAILAGPMLAEEIKIGLPTKVTVGSTGKNFQKRPV